MKYLQECYIMNLLTVLNIRCRFVSKSNKTALQQK